MSITDLLASIFRRQFVSLDSGEAILWMQRHQSVLQNTRVNHISLLRVMSRKTWKLLELPAAAKLELDEAQRSVTDIRIDEGRSGPMIHLPMVRAPAARMIIESSDGCRYEVDRFCPHKGADMIGSIVDGNLLVCPKHRWKFDLHDGGRCINGKSQCSIRAKRLDW